MDNVYFNAVQLYSFNKSKTGMKSTLPEVINELTAGQTNIKSSQMSSKI